MNTTNDKRPRMPVGDTRRALPLLAVVLLLLAGLLAWSGVRQWRDAALLDDMQRARDAAASAVESAYRAQTGQLAQRLASAPVKAALDRNDSAAAVAALREGWTGVEQVEIHDGALESAYADAAAFGFSKLALLEAGMQGEAVGSAKKQCTGGPSRRFRP